MHQQIGYVVLLVRDYDEAIAYFTGALGFRLVDDRPLGDAKRWVLIAPSESSGTSLLLAKAVTASEQAALGNQAGGRVFMFLHTDDFRRDYDGMRSRGVIFEETPQQEPYGTVAVFKDLYGNRWDLLQPLD